MILQFWVFSYNRGEFLKNCIASIEQCAPGCGIRIFDDDSNDPATCAVLIELGGKYKIYHPEPQKDSQSKHGGLYANMQSAYEASQPEELVCFLQDDMQLVRPIAADEIAVMDDFLTRVEKPCLIYPAFLKGVNKNNPKNAIDFNSEYGFYFLSNLKKSVGVFYSDICLFKVKRLMEVNWRFVARESNNENAARAMLGKMAYLRDPFVFYLPYVPSYRGKTQTLALRLAQKMRNCGFYPFQYLTRDENQAFLQRGHETLPYAEDFLKTSETLPEPWIYYPLQGKAWLKHLNSLEVKLRRWLMR